MQFEGALIKEQGITFSIFIVKSHVLNSTKDRENVREELSILFPNMPIILMSQDSRGTPTYQGRKDIVNFLSKIHLSQIPWKRYTIS